MSFSFHSQRSPGRSDTAEPLAALSRPGGSPLIRINLDGGDGWSSPGQLWQVEALRHHFAAVAHRKRGFCWDVTTAQPEPPPPGDPPGLGRFLSLLVDDTDPLSASPRPVAEERPTRRRHEAALPLAAREGAP